MEDRKDDRKREGPEEREDTGSREPGEKVKRAQPEEEAEEETTEDIDRAFD